MKKLFSFSMLAFFASSCFAYSDYLSNAGSSVMTFLSFLLIAWVVLKILNFTNMKKTITMTLFSKMVSIICMITIFTACGSSYEVGDKIRLIEDCPAADSPSNAQLLRNYIRKEDNESAMRMFYLGNAGRMEKSSIITIKQKQGDYYQVDYNNDIPFVHWTYKAALDRNGKKFDKRHNIIPRNSRSE